MVPKRYKYSILLRTIFLFAGFIYCNIEQREETICVDLKRTRKTTRCPKCGRRTSLTGEYYPRLIRDMSLGPMDCYVSFMGNKIFCKCGFRGHEQLSFVRPYARCTIRFEQYAFGLCQKMSLTDVCKVLGIGWKTAKEIDVFYTKQQLESLNNLWPLRLGIDEIAYEKGHNYLTIVRDADTNKVIWIGVDRTEETLGQFFKELGFYKCSRLTAIVVDMWDPYIASIRKHCPGAEIVFDKFHVVKHINKALDDIRKQEFSRASEEQRREMKHKRFLILRRHDNLTEIQKESLTELMNQNDTLYKAYLLKEQISDIMDEQEPTTATNRITDWLKNVEESALVRLQKCAQTITNYLYGIINYFKHQITNAGSEGLNNKINVIKRRAYGYADLDYFMLKIFQACGVMKQ